MTPKLLDALDSFKKQFDFNDENVAKQNFLSALFHAHNAIESSKGIGKKGLLEFIKLLNYLTSKRDEIKFVVDLYELDIHTAIGLRKLFVSVPLAFVDSFLIDKNVSALSLSFYISRKSLSKTSLAVFDAYFNKCTSKTYSEIAVSNNISRERVRQILIQLKTKNIITSISETINLFPRIYIYECSKAVRDKISFRVLLEEKTDFIFDDVLHDPNFDYKKLFFMELFRQEHIIIDEIFDNLSSNKIIYDISKVIIFIKTEAVKRLKLTNFFEFINSEIYNFEIAEFEYDLNVLIKRFFESNSISISNKEIDDLAGLLNSLERNPLFISKRLHNEIIKQRELNIIYESILQIISNFNSSFRTNDLLSNLHNAGVEIDKRHLLIVLNHFPEFKKFGSDTWLYVNNIYSDQLEGSLVQIVANILDTYKVPKHISEFIDLFSNFRLIDERSLLTNLKSSKQFILFNCGFIGLKRLNYDEYYRNLPKVSGSRFSLKNIEKIKKNYDGKVAEAFQELYSYPQIHTNYLLRKNSLQ